MTLADPWLLALILVLVAGFFITLYALRGYIREFLILAVALPQALFKKVFGPPRQ
jgi:hypothetical protein